MGAARVPHLLLVCLALAVASAAGSTAVAGKATPTYVGSVTAVGGTKNVKMRATAASPAVTVKAGTRIQLGATIIMGKGAKATLRLTRPSSVPKTRTLAFVRSAPGATHTSTVMKNAKGVVTVRIAPG